MNYSNIIPFDFANGEGVRTSLFVSGCDFHCEDCFNKSAQKFDFGKEFDEKTEEMICALLDDNRINGLSILGGDPLCQDTSGLITLFELCTKAHEKNKNVWLWSGYTWEEVMNPAEGTQMTFLKYLQMNLIKSCDVFIDGRYEKDKKDLTLAWRGSSNQRIIDVKKTLETEGVVLYGKS